MEGYTPSATTPRPTHVGVGLGLDPLLQGLFAQLQGQGTPAPVLLAHDMHAPLVACFSAALTRNGFEDLGLFAVLADDEMADVDGAVHAGTGALQASVVGLNSVVVIVGGWVRVGCARLSGVHSSVPTFL